MPWHTGYKTMYTKKNGYGIKIIPLNTAKFRARPGLEAAVIFIQRTALYGPFRLRSLPLSFYDNSKENT